MSKSRGVHVFIENAGVSLHCVVWKSNAPKAMIALLHGLESNSQWFDELGGRLMQMGYLVAAVDRPGAGLSTGRRGDIDSATALFDHLRAVMRCLDLSLPAFCVTLSWGAHWGLAHAIQYPQDFRGIALLAPGLFLQKPYPLSTKLLIAATAQLELIKAIRAPVSKDELFTSRTESLRFIASDPQRLSTVTPRFLLQSWRMRRVIARRGRRLESRILHLVAGRDRICDNERNRALLMEIVPTDRYSEVVYPDADHSLVFECDRYDVAGDIDRWICSS